MRILAIAFLFLAAPCVAQTAPAPAPDIADIEIARIDDSGTAMELKAKFYLPPASARTASMPLLLYIHGKGGAYNDPRDKVVLRVLEAMGRRGIAVARIDYRKSGRMPAMLFDTKAYI